MNRSLIYFTLLLLSSSYASAQSTNPIVTQSNLSSTVCKPGWAAFCATQGVRAGDVASYRATKPRWRRRRVKPEVDIYDGTQHSGKETPDREQRDAEKSIGDHEKEQRDRTE